MQSPLEHATALDAAFRSLSPSERPGAAPRRNGGPAGAHHQLRARGPGAATPAGRVPASTQRSRRSTPGRLFPETYDLWALTEARYGLRVRSFGPDAGQLQALVAAQGINGFYDSPAHRSACCWGAQDRARLNQALAGAAGWITGLRADQSANRGQMAFVEWDAVLAGC